MSTNNKPGIIMTLIGTPILLGGLFWAYKSIQYSMRAVDVKGAIVAVLEDTCERSTGSGSNKRRTSYTCYQPVVAYQYENQTYKTHLSERSSEKYALGENFNLKIDPQHPQKASTGADLWIGPAFLCIFGLIVAGIGAALLRRSARKKASRMYLKKNGLRVRAQVIDVGPDRSISYNGKNPFRVRAQFNNPMTQEPIVVEETEIWHDPRLSGDIALDNSVEVFYDPKNAKHCTIVLGNDLVMKVA